MRGLVIHLSDNATITMPNVDASKKESILVSFAQATADGVIRLNFVDQDKAVDVQKRHVVWIES